MPARAGAKRIPEDLGIHMRMRVDEARRNHMAVGIDYLARGLVHFPDGGDSSVDDPHVGPIPWEAGAIHHRAITNDQIVSHFFSPPGMCRGFIVAALCCCVTQRASPYRPFSARVHPFSPVAPL